MVDANESVAFWLVFMCMITFIFLICSVRTNVAFVVLFTSLTLTFALLAAAFFLNADNITANASTAGKLVVVSHPPCTGLLHRY
jgi:succinate-acetate transporter protein